MLKKLISVLLAVCMVFCLTACGTGQLFHIHSYSDATCTSPKKCSCGETTGIAMGHQFSPATCTNPQTCSRCGRTSGDVLGHDYSEASCNLPKTCNRCGVTAGTALGHQFSPATCTSPQICSRCGITEGNALDHDYTDANCVLPKTCTRCGQTTGSELGHDYVDNICSRCEKVDPNSLPVGLHQLHIVDGNSLFYKYDENSFQDTFGNTYNGVHIFGDRHSGVETVVFNLDYKYKTFTGSIVASSRLASCAYADYYIYVDDQLVYSYTEQEKTTGIINFEIDVTNASKLSIRAGAYKKPGAIAVGYMGCGCIVNAQLTK